MNDHARPACSVIIPSYQSARTIEACLAALVQQQTSLPYEMILVDSSSDATTEIVRRDFPQVRLIHLQQQTDPAAARNIGAAHARAEILAFIDSDCTAAPDWLERLYHAMQQGYAAVGGAIANANGETLVSWAGYMCEFREFLPGTAPRATGSLTLGNAAYRRAALEQVGGFPEHFFPQEDQVLHRRLSEHGHRIAFDSRILVAHSHRTDYHAFLDHQRRIGRANARVLQTIELSGSGLARRPWLALLVLPLLIPLRFVRTIFACLGVEHGLLLRQPRIAWLCWQGICSWGRGFAEGVAVQQPQQQKNKEASVWQRLSPNLN